MSQGLEGVRINQGQQEVYNPLNAISTSSGAYGQGANSAWQRSRMGSGFGDVMSGLGGVVGLGASGMKLGNQVRNW